MKKTQLKDTDFEGLSSEDQLYLFWQRYRRAVFGVFWVLLAALLGYQGTQWIKAWRLEQMQEAYTRLEDTQGRVAFIKNYKHQPLAGAVALQLADEAFGQERFQDAFGHYDQAAIALRKELLSGRAALGAAMALLRMGETSEATRRLGVLSADPQALGSIRAEAYYILGLQALEAGETAEGFLKAMRAIDDSAPWVSRLELFSKKSSGTL